jgi:uncharacterized protein (DUF2062 family)
MSRSTLRERIRALLTLGESPRKLKFAFATGVFIAFCPLVGLHTILAVAVTWAFRFNPVAVMVGAFINNPWTFVPIYGGGLWLGLQLWPPTTELPRISFVGISFVDFLTQLRPYLIPFVLGTTFAALVASVLAYWVMHMLILGYRKAARVKAGEKAGKPETDPNAP